MYAFAPVSLAALRKRDADRPRPYRTPIATLLAPIGFVSANLIVYWGGYDTTWKILAAVVVGLVVFAVSRATTPAKKRRPLEPRAAIWTVPWLLGLGVIGYLGRYGDTSRNILPDWIDLLVVIGFSLAIFYWAVSCALTTEKVQAAVVSEEAELVTAGSPL
jgi:amino acid transporter